MKKRRAGEITTLECRAEANEEVDKALKLDPSNVELLAQREALLAKQIEQTRDKLELQEEAAKAAAQAAAAGGGMY